MVAEKVTVNAKRAGAHQKGVRAGLRAAFDDRTEKSKSVTEAAKYWPKNTEIWMTG